MSEPSPQDRPSEATLLLQRMAEGDPSAKPALFSAIYGELHRLAEAHMAGQAASHTLQPTALVHEAWLRLADGDTRLYQDSEHFLSFASRVMRSVLVDHARRRRTQKRGAGQERVPLDAAVDAYAERNIDVEALNEALLRLAEDEPALVRVVDLHVFGGLTMPRAAEVLGVSRATVERKWSLARIWLRSALDPEVS